MLSLQFISNSMNRSLIINQLRNITHFAHYMLLYDFDFLPFILIRLERQNTYHALSWKYITPTSSGPCTTTPWLDVLAQYLKEKDLVNVYNERDKHIYNVSCILLVPGNILYIQIFFISHFFQWGFFLSPF